MNLRLATPSDISAIAHLHAASWRHAYRGALSDEYLAGNIVADRTAVWTQRLSAPEAYQRVTVVEENNHIVGFACAFANHDDTWGTLLDNIHVSLSKHRCGIGSILIRDLATWCVEENSTKGLYLWVIQSNVAAQRFYESLGAQNVGTDTWLAPDSSAIPRFRYAWTNIHTLHG